MMKRKKRIKQPLIFLAAALLVCLGASLFLTEGGIAKLYPLAVRAGMEEFSPSGNSYTVYYNARAKTASSDVIVVGIDPEIAQSYDALGHFFRFAKQYSEISTVLLPVSEGETESINVLLSSASSEIQGNRLALLDSSSFSVDFVDFLTELAYVNATVTPVRKFTAASLLDENGTVSAGILEKMNAELAGQRKTCFAVVDMDLIENGTLEIELEEMFGEELMLIKTRYSGRDYDGTSVLKLPFTGSAPKCSFVSAANMSGFNNYANSVLNYVRGGDKVDYAEKISEVEGDGFFFVITNGTAEVYENSNK